MAKVNQQEDIRTVIDQDLALDVLCFRDIKKITESEQKNLQWSWLLSYKGHISDVNKVCCHGDGPQGLVQ